MTPSSPPVAAMFVPIIANQITTNNRQKEERLNTEVKQQPPVNDKLKQEELGIFTLKVFITAVIISALIAYIILKRENIYGIKNRNPKDKNGSITLYE